IVILADARRRAYARVENDSSEEGRRTYTANLDRLRQARAARDEAFARAAPASGLERARHLDRALAALSTLPSSVVMVEYPEAVPQILALDAEDRAGLRTKYARYPDVAWRARDQEAQAALQRRDWRGALAGFEAILTDLKPTGQAAEETRIGRAQAL